MPADVQCGTCGQSLSCSAASGEPFAICPKCGGLVHLLVDNESPAAAPAESLSILIETEAGQSADDLQTGAADCPVDVDLNPYTAPRQQLTQSAPGALPAAESTPNGHVVWHQLVSVASGLGLINAGNWIAMIATVGALVLESSALLRISGGASPAQAADIVESLSVVFVGVLIAEVVAVGLAIVGLCRCFQSSAPPWSEHLLGIAMVGLVGGAMLSAICWFETLSPALAIVAGLLGLIASVAFVRYLDNLATFIGRRDLARRARYILWSMVASSVLIVCAVAVGAALLRDGNNAASHTESVVDKLVIAFSAVSIAVFWSFIVLIRDVRKEVVVNLERCMRIGWRSHGNATRLR